MDGWGVCGSKSVHGAGGGGEGGGCGGDVRASRQGCCGVDRTRRLVTSVHVLLLEGQGPVEY